MTAGALAILDHLVVTAPTLAAGRVWTEARLGVPLQDGGRHVRMGTHNALLRLGEGCYLEVIAVDPGLPPPGRPRWFALDGLAADATPRLTAWMARTTDLDAAVAACPVPVGEILRMERGDLSWRIAVPPDGALVLGGLAPGLIAWDGDAHPAARLEDRGCSLLGVTARAAAADAVVLGGVLEALGLGGAMEIVPVAAPVSGRLVARIATPSGIRTLD